jgi:hypothetical protein
MDEIADLADRAEARRRRGERWEFEFAALSTAEREEFMALMNERIARGREVLEAVAEDVRILKLLLAYREGAITALEFVHRVRGAV